MKKTLTFLTALVLSNVALAANVHFKCVNGSGEESKFTLSQDDYDFMRGNNHLRNQKMTVMRLRSGGLTLTLNGESDAARAIFKCEKLN